MRPLLYDDADIVIGGRLTDGMTSTLWLAGESALLPSRIQMAFTLASHVLLVPLGVALPALTLLMEGIGIARNDPVALKIARRWSVVMAVQFAVGAVTGTILSFEFGILWPRMMGRFGDVFGVGFAIEGVAFFLEAIFIGIYLYGWTRLPPKIHYRLGWVLPPAGVLGAFGVIIATRGVFGDQPAKFAAMEIAWTTQGHNPEILGGILGGDGRVVFGLSIPTLDSLLAGFSPDTVVRGLSTFNADARPSVVEASIVHLAFDVMVGLGSIACLLTLWYAVAWIRTRDLPRSVWFFRAAALAGVGSYMGIESGWVTTEVGRQPWIVHNLMRVSDSVNPVNALNIWVMFGALLVLYAVIGYFFITVLLRLSKRWRLEDAGGPVRDLPAPEVAAPYGPPPP